MRNIAFATHGAITQKMDERMQEVVEASQAQKARRLKNALPFCSGSNK